MSGNGETARRAQRVSHVDEEHGCVGCHQLGNLATRTVPESLGHFASSEQAWLRRIQSGQAGAQMVNIAQGALTGIPIRYLADWTDRIAAGELQRPLRRVPAASSATWSRRCAIGPMPKPICTTCRAPIAATQA